MQDTWYCLHQLQSSRTVHNSRENQLYTSEQYSREYELYTYLKAGLGFHDGIVILHTVLGKTRYTYHGSLREQAFVFSHIVILMQRKI